MFRMVVACPTCRGRGVRVEPSDVCDECEGQGKVAARRTVVVKIPAGVHEGQAVRVAGEGEGGDSADAPAGDLICYVAVKPHPVFTRQGDDLVCQVPVSFTTAALGGGVDVPTLGPPADKGRTTVGTDALEVRPGTQHGEVFKLRGRGLPDARGGRGGDLIVQAMVEIPKKLTERQRDLLRQFAETEDGGDHHRDAMPQRKNWLDKLKDLISGD